MAEVLWGPWVDVAEAAGAAPAADADVGTSKILSGSPASGSSLKKVTGRKLSRVQYSKVDVIDSGLLIISRGHTYMMSAQRGEGGYPQKQT